VRVLLNTVGTSVLQSWKELGQAYDERHRAALVAALSGLPESDRRLGAELTAIRSLVRQGELESGDRLYFLLSDTREGRFVGGVLSEVVAHWGFPAENRTIRNLQGDDPGAFVQGLRYLVKEIARVYRAHKEHGEVVAINATGGYKAQIAFAGLIGQVFGLPVYYQFEAFPQAIKLPPLPVSFDMEQWLAYRHVFEPLDEGDGGDLLRADDPRVKQLPSELGVLLDRSQGYVTLNALGALYHEGFQSRFRAQADRLLPKDAGLKPEEKKISFEDQNGGRHRGLAEWVERIRRARYVTRIQTFYYNPGLPGRSGFEPDPAQGDRAIGIYADHGATTKCYVFLSENDPRRAQAAAADLARTFG
jgi:putative CRISPR-associated protein (TIGR02619 family)